MKDTLLMVEFHDHHQSLMPCGYIYSRTYKHRLSFLGLENLTEKINRIYYLLGISDDPSEYPGNFEMDRPFFVKEECLKSQEQWLSPDTAAEDMMPGRWSRCMVIHPLGGRASCWQGIVIESHFRHTYKDVHELKELLGYIWLRLKFPESYGASMFTGHRGESQIKENAI